MKSKQTKSKFNQWKNYQAVQECILIGLLNPYCDIRIKKPYKKSTVTIPFVVIEKIIFNQHDSINIAEFIEKRCQERMEYELKIGVSPQTALRRYKTNKFTETIHLLMDLLIEKGFFFHTSIPPQKQHCQPHETIHSIFDKEGKYYTKNSIISTGTLINTYFTTHFQKHATFTLKRKDKRIQHLIQHNWETISTF